MSKASTETLNPDDIRKIETRTVEKIIRLGDGFIAFVMPSVEDDRTQIDNTRFQSTIVDIMGFFAEQDFKPVPIESLDLISEKLSVHRVKLVDMVVPYRKPPRGNYLKWDRTRNEYLKLELEVKKLHIQGTHFIVVAMDPMWEYAKG